MNTNLYFTFYREYDSRIALWWANDPYPTPCESLFVSMRNNPILYNDKLGAKVKANNETSANRLKSTIQNSFKGDDAKALRSLFKLSDDGLKMATIDEEKFTSTVANLTPAQQDLAYAYYSAINDPSNTHIVEMINHWDNLSSEVKSAVNYTTGQEVDAIAGGGVNIKTPSGSYSIINMDANSSPTYEGKNASKQPSSLGETLSHEMLGHGVGAVFGSATAGYEDAIQMSNLNRRSQGYTSYRTGEDHERSGKAVMTTTKANQLPSHILIPYDIQAKIASKGSSVNPVVPIDNNVSEPNIIINPPNLLK